MIASLLFLFASLAPTNSYACSCHVGASQFEQSIVVNAISQQKRGRKINIVVGEIKGYSDHGADIHVLDWLSGEEKKETIRVWGTPTARGRGDCRDKMSEYPIGTRHVFLLDVLDYGEGQEKKGDFVLYWQCSVNHLAIEFSRLAGAIVRGRIAHGVSSMPLGEFEKLVAKTFKKLNNHQETLAKTKVSCHLKSSVLPDGIKRYNVYEPVAVETTMNSRYIEGQSAKPADPSSYPKEIQELLERRNLRAKFTIKNEKFGNSILERELEYIIQVRNGDNELVAASAGTGAFDLSRPDLRKGTHFLQQQVVVPAEAGSKLGNLNTWLWCKVESPFQPGK